MFVSSLPFIVAMTILLKICKFLEMLINHFQIKKIKKIQVFLLGFFLFGVPDMARIKEVEKSAVIMILERI